MIKRIKAQLAVTIHLVFLGALVDTASAHMFWVEPEQFVVNAGEELTATLEVGDGPTSTNFPYLSHRFKSFSLFSNGRKTDVSGREGDDPAVRLKQTPTGLISINYYSESDTAEFNDDWEGFTEYLEENGLTEFQAVHRARGISETDFSEEYFRCAKSLVQAGPVREGDADRYQGMPLEFVVAGNPYAKSPTGEIKIKLLWQGEPLPQAFVRILRANDGLVESNAVTDGAGEITLPTDKRGILLLNAVYLSAGPSTGSADWISHWASLTFELR